MEIMQGSEIMSPAKMKMTLRYSVQRQTLVVTVHHIEDLHFDERINLYVQTDILPDGIKESQRKSKAILTSKNPVFDTTFEYAIPQDEFDHKHLKVSLMEQNSLSQNVPIAQVTIDLDKLGLVLPYTRYYKLFKTSK